MIDVYELAKQRISMAENVTEKFVEVRKNIEATIAKKKNKKYPRSEASKAKQREYKKEYKKRPEYKRKHAEYMRVWRQKNENYRERNKLRMRLRRKKLKELATTSSNNTR